MTGRRALGVLGGTFDPPHRSHLRVAQLAARRYDLDTVLLVPAGDPPHKLPGTPAVHRVAMCRIAVAPFPDLEVSTVELERPGPHYTADTLELLAERYPNDDLVFIAGSDIDRRGWHRSDDLAGLARFVSFSRDPLNSTTLRAALAAGTPACELDELRAGVADYITTHGLYPAVSDCVPTTLEVAP